MPPQAPPRVRQAPRRRTVETPLVIAAGRRGPAPRGRDAAARQRAWRGIGGAHNNPTAPRGALGRPPSPARTLVLGARTAAGASGAATATGAGHDGERSAGTERPPGRAGRRRFLDSSDFAVGPISRASIAVPVCQRERESARPVSRLLPAKSAGLRRCARACGRCKEYAQEGGGLAAGRAPYLEP